MRCAYASLALILAGCGGPKPAGDGVATRPTPTPAPEVFVEMRGPVSLQAELARLASSVEGPVAISVRDVGEGWAVRSGATGLQPQQSVSKTWVALALLDQVDRGKLGIDQTVTLTRSDITLFHQPIASLIGAGGYRTTVSDLLERALTQSDNTANDRLLTLVGGPDSVRRTLLEKGVAGIRFGPGERILQSGTAGLAWSPTMTWGGFERARRSLPAHARASAYRRYVEDPQDGATADAISMTLARLQAGELLSPRSTARMLAVMSRSRTGRARLRAGLPPGWRLAHKTGTGQNYAGRTAGYNDVGLLYAPDGHAYAVAVLIGDTSSPERRRQALIASVARAVVAAHRARHPLDGGQLVAHVPSS